MATPKPLADALRWDKPLHREVLHWLKMMANRAAEGNLERHARWNQIEKTLRLYVAPDAVDGEGNLRNVYQTQLEVPWARVCYDTVQTAIWLPWADRRPVIPIDSDSPDGMYAAQLMAIRADYDLRKTNFHLKHFAWTGDATAFGFGAIENRWISDKRIRTRVDKNGRKREIVEHYEGNWLWNVDPYRALIDREVPAGLHQHGTYCGYSYDVSNAELKRMAKRTNELGEGWFNVDKLDAPGNVPEQPFLFGSRNASVRNRVQNLSDPGDWLGARVSIEGGGRELRLNYHIVTPLEVCITPRDLADRAARAGLNEMRNIFQAMSAADPSFDMDEQQYWRFTIVDGKYLVDMEPLAQTEFSIHVMEPHPDLRSRYVPGLVDLALDMQAYISQLMNTHIANVERGLTGVTIFDPEAINEKDMQAAVYGGLAPIKMERWGTDVRNAVFSLPWNDATRQNLADIPMIADMMQRLTGASDQAQGLVSQGRRAATDVQQAAAGSTSRLRMLSKHYAIGGLNPLFRQMIQNIQLFDEADRWFQITGGMERLLSGAQGSVPPPLDRIATQQVMGAGGGQSMFAKITPEDVQGTFDIAVLDGRPQDEDTQKAGSYIQLLQTLGQMGAFAPGQPQQPGGQPTPARFDPFWFVSRIANCLGVKNLNEASLMPRPNQQALLGPEAMQERDEALLGEVNKGNLVPLGGSFGA